MASQELCPGMFRCRGGKCLSLLKVCDGYPECHRGDDEILCNFKCPDGCECRGLTYKCKSIPQSGFSKYARNIDVSQIPVDLNTLDLNSYLNLASLNLSGCMIDSLLPENTSSYFENLVNLRILDLSNNKLKVINPNVFSGLKYLNKLILSDNKELTQIMTEAFYCLENVHILRIVRTKLKTMEENAFYGMTSLDFLDLSNNSLSVLNKGVFNGLTSVKYLDIRYNMIYNIYRGMFSKLPNLILLKTNVYKLCCTITITGKEITCTADEGKVSSCENLIKFEVLRLSIWIIGGVALLGNLCVLCYKFLYDRSRISHSYSIFIIALSISDMLMGVYMIVVAAMDARYRNKYIWHDQEWRSSSFCAIAGFIATVSSESSAILVCLIAVDRCLAIRLPYSRFKVTLKYAIMLSIGSFLIAVILAAVPLLPLSYFDGKFYSRSTVCIALPLTSDRPPGWHYSVAVFVGFNMVLFFTVGISQTIIYRDVRKTMSSARNKQLSVEIKVARSHSWIIWRGDTIRYICLGDCIYIASQLGYQSIPLYILSEIQKQLDG
ncbi:hypothetical protein KUTeg_013530 [Tegillarca granosa]|uniref:G-protein coupled receptors family 1 profile domain-containing protein n=1 Tax=Tegillarca granosa TaxID=220873 RepID=A0ABQ9EWE0_TEGGR|nr:hypothetical protein KUTeg_013530 [Tegillarca granosa]